MSEKPKLNCNYRHCGKLVDPQKAVACSHRVVGKGIDVSGGPTEYYHLECMARLVDDYRGWLSDAYAKSEEFTLTQNFQLTTEQTVALVKFAAAFNLAFRIRGQEESVENRQGLRLPPHGGVVVALREWNDATGVGSRGDSPLTDTDEIPF